MRLLQYTTPTGICVSRTVSKAPYKKGLRHLLRELDTHRGIYLSSGYEYPGRYSRWDIASVRPPLEIVALGPARRVPPAEPARRDAHPDAATRCWPTIRTGRASSLRGRRAARAV